MMILRVSEIAIQPATGTSLALFAAMGEWQPG